MRQEVSVSVIIPCRDRAAQLERCLGAVGQLSPAPCEVIVVDSASVDAAQLRAAAEHGGARYLRTELAGISRAKNAGARAANADIAAFLDDDAMPATDWLAHLTAKFEDPKVACVTGRMEPDPTADVDRALYQALGYVRSEAAPAHIWPTDPDWFEKACFGGIGVSSNLALRRTVLSEWKGFNERIGLGNHIAGGEEGYAFMELVRKGFGIVYAPDAIVYHPVPPPPREQLTNRLYSNIAAGTAFLLLLACEERGYRTRALRVLLKKLRWRSLLRRGSFSAETTARIGTTGAIVMARLKGVMLYLNSVFVRIFESLHHRTRGPRTASERATQEQA